MHFTPTTRCFQSAVNHVCVRLFARETIGLESEKVNMGENSKAKFDVQKHVQNRAEGNEAEVVIMPSNVFTVR